MSIEHMSAEYKRSSQVPTLQSASLLFLAPFLLLLSAQSALGQGFKMTQLNVPNAQTANTWPHGVNASEDVVGYYVNTSGATLGFVYAGGKYTNISYPGATGYTRASGINDSGAVVGDYQVNGDNIIHGYTYDVATQVYTQYDVGTESTSLFGINNAGDYAGAEGDNGVVEGFITIDGKATSPFFASGTDNTYAYALNSHYEAVGEFFDSSNNFHGFSRTKGGAFTQIDYPGAIDTVCFGITDAGEITGTYINASGLPYGFTYTKSKFATTDFAGTRGINNKGAYDGIYWGVDGVQQAYLAVPQTLRLATIKIAKAQQGAFYGVNNSGVYVGNYVDSSGKEHGMMISGGKVKNIDDTKGVSTYCLAINSSKVIVGDYWDSNGNPHGFKYAAGKFTDIPGPTGALSTDVTGINDAGEIAGDFFASSDRTHHGFVLKGGKYKQLNVPGATATFSGGINATGLVTFFWVDSVGYVQSSLYNGKKYTAINVVGAAATYVHGINKAGDIVYTWFDPYGVEHGGLKKGNAYYVFDDPAGFGTAGEGINDTDLLVGYFTPTGQNVSQPFKGTE
jgi:hypothetical protein